MDGETVGTATVSSYGCEWGVSDDSSGFALDEALKGCLEGEGVETGTRTAGTEKI
jgi:hypothetical protein